MPTHENIATLKNSKPKKGLNGRAGGPVEAAPTVGEIPYALGDDMTTGAQVRIPDRPTAINASSPGAGTIRVNITAWPDASGLPASYAVYRGSTLVGTTTTTGANVDFTGVPSGTYSITVRGRDEDDREFTESAATTGVVVA